MDLLPPLHIRSALLSALSLLISHRGFETFIRAPLLEPCGAHFPDSWEPSARGVRLLSLRLLSYAGLGDLDATVVLYSNDPERTPTADESHRIEGAAAWFAGIEDDVCLFGADRRQLQEADAIVGTMCHEIAHAYRRHHGIESNVRRIDEEHTDITTIYLGFGLLSVNNAHRYRTRGGLMNMRWSTSETGYLPLQSMSFLLAAQCVARGLSTGEIARLGRQLESNQRACFDEACRELGADVDALRAELGIPPVEVWPEEKPFEIEELREDALFRPMGEAAAWREGFARFNQGHTVFRIARTKAAVTGTVGAITFGLASLALADRLAWSPTACVIASAMVGWLAGAALGRRIVTLACSEPRCMTVLPASATNLCPKCGGTLRGTLDDPEDRLAAEEALDAGQPMDAVRRDLAARTKRGTRIVRWGVLVVGTLAAVFATLDSLPRAASVQLLADDRPELRTEKLWLTGRVVDPIVGTTSLVDDRGTQLVPFRFSDGTGQMIIWCDRSKLVAPLAKSDHVRVTGQSFRVPDEAGSKIRFIASSVERE